MTHYRGTLLEPILRGGVWDAKQEIFNFAPIAGRLYGYAQPTKGAITLKRIEAGHSGDRLDRVLVIFFASRGRGQGQVIVGWYRDATVYRHEPDLPAKILKLRQSCRHHFEARARDACLLPVASRKHEIPRGKGATGYSMITYALDAKQIPLTKAWVRQAVAFVRSYDGPNLLREPNAKVEDSVANAGAQVLDATQGFAPTSAERKLIERYAIEKAKARYRVRYHIEERGRPYDLLCTSKTDPTQTLHVEVKGTQGSGESVILTANEVAHARRNRHRMHLVVVHSIRLIGVPGSARKAAGGRLLLLKRWSPAPAALTPLAYYCQLTT